jgi:hypothetical protein
MIQVICAGCFKTTLKAVGAVNRARDKGVGLYCNKTCFHMSRRLKNPPSEAERKAAKRLYDKRRREEKGDEIRAKKLADYYARHEHYKRRIAQSTWPGMSPTASNRNTRRGRANTTADTGPSRSSENFQKRRCCLGM